MTTDARPGLWRIRDFRRFAAADAISKLGSQVTFVALPLTAALTLEATPFEVGLLTAAETVAFLLVGLPAGAWVDRIRRRPVLITADLVRAVALLSIPVAAWAGTLSLPHLYGVALVAGLGTVFFDVAQQSILPSIVDTEDLTRANGVVAASFSIAQLTGPGLGGWLVQLFTAPIAMLADGVSYLVSAVLLMGARVREERPPSGPRQLRREIAEGIRFVAGQPVIRVIAIVGAMSMFAFGMWTAALPLFLIREIGVGPGAYGLVLSLSAVGGIVGAALAHRVAARFVMWGGAPRGGLVGGALGQTAGVRVAFAAACGAFAAAQLPAVVSRSVRRLR
ncbi:MFS transporter [Streptosporangiaceae bacterium NEAU-GS5]|nr:MFS transporter [Streptosporangiaceae bacterium NEAU-GS5]